MAKRKLTEEQLQQAFAWREAGRSVRWIANRLNISEGAISWHCLKAGVESPRTARGAFVSRVMPGAVEQRGDHLVRRYSEAEDRLILTMAARGATNTEIGRALTPSRAPNSIQGRLMTLARREERLASQQEQAA